MKRTFEHFDCMGDGITVQPCGQGTYAATIHEISANGDQVGVHLTPNECDALAAALTQAAARKRALDAERSVTP